jgi:hypothetical protein
MHICRVGLWLLVASLVLVFTPVQAEWNALEAQYQLHPLQTAYVERGTIHREGHLVTLSALIDWKAMQGGRSPTRFYSTTLSKQFDCKDRLVRTLAATDFYDHMGAAEVIGGGSPTQAKAIGLSWSRTYSIRACGKQRAGNRSESCHRPRRHRYILFGRRVPSSSGSTAKSTWNGRNDTQPTDCWWLTVDSAPPVAQHPVL